MLSWSIRVTGKVQGVWFRASTQQKARELNLTGWVRNEPDGSVLILVQGLENHLKTFREWCHEGPVHARVDEVATEEVQDEESWSGFEIVR